MTKIVKTDIDNIKIIKKETKIDKILKIKIKKGNYEIEITSENSNILNPINNLSSKISELKSPSQGEEGFVERSTPNQDQMPNDIGEEKNKNEQEKS